MSESATPADQTIARITELARQALQAQADIARQSIEFGRATLSSEVDASSAGRAWLDAVGRESTRYWTEVGALGLDIAGQLVALGSRSMARVMTDTRSAATRGASRTSTTSTSRGPASRAQYTGWQRDAKDGPARPVDLSEPETRHREADAARDADGTEVAGAATDEMKRGSVTLRSRAGETASGTVTLANQHRRARRVLLSPGTLRPESGRRVSLELRVDPDGVTIPAMAEQEVRLEVELRSDVVRPGERYGGIIGVSGGVEAVLDVTAVVEQ